MPTSRLVVWWESHSPIAVSMLLAHRLRRRPNIETALGECPVFGGQVLAMRIFLLQAYICTRRRRSRRANIDLTLSRGSWVEGWGGRGGFRNIHYKNILCLTIDLVCETKGNFRTWSSGNLGTSELGNSLSGVPELIYFIWKLNKISWLPALSYVLTFEFLVHSHIVYLWIYASSFIHLVTFRPTLLEDFINVLCTH